MTGVASIYRRILPPWICVTVYAWALELRAVLGTDPEPVSAWLADCFAILLTLIFWVLLFCLPLALVGDRDAWCAAARWLGHFHA